MTPANDNLPRRLRAHAWPTLSRLNRDNRPAAGVLIKWQDLTNPVTVEAANDNAATGGFDFDRDLEIRPTVDELMRAKAGDEVPRFGGFKGRVSYLGELEFYKGKLIAWGTTSRGLPLKPVERLRGPKGRRDADVDTIDEGGRLAGFCRPSGTARQADVGEHAAETEMARRSDERMMRRLLGDHAQILDAACGDATARKIGEMRGYAGKTAERHGIRLVDQALAALRCLLDENILEQAA